MWNVAVLELVGSSFEVVGNSSELVGNSFEVGGSSLEAVNSSSEVDVVVVGMTLSAGKRSFPSEVARWSDVVCTPPEVGPSEAVEAAEADCNIEGALAQRNYGVKRWRLSSPGNWS